MCEGLIVSSGRRLTWQLNHRPNPCAARHLPPLFFSSYSIHRHILWIKTRGLKIKQNAEKIKCIIYMCSCLFLWCVDISVCITPPSSLSAHTPSSTGTHTVSKETWSQRNLMLSIWAQCTALFLCVHADLPHRLMSGCTVLAKWDHCRLKHACSHISHTHKTSRWFVPDGIIFIYADQAHERKHHSSSCPSAGDTSVYSTHILCCV